jgi:hypothetical protein
MQRVLRYIDSMPWRFRVVEYKAGGWMARFQRRVTDLRLNPTIVEAHFLLPTK